jgi:hypothetical protein
MKTKATLFALGIALLGLMAAPALAGENGRQNRGRRDGARVEKKGKTKAKKVEVKVVPTARRHVRPRTVVRRVPRRVQPAPRRARRHYVPGHYEVRTRQVWVPGTVTRVWVEPVYRQIRIGRRGTIRICVRRGYFENVRSPGHYELRRERVWVPGHWTCR